MGKRIRFFVLLAVAFVACLALVRHFEGSPTAIVIGVGAVALWVVEAVTRTERRIQYLAPFAWLAFFVGAIAVAQGDNGRSFHSLGAGFFLLAVGSLWSDRRKPGHVRMYRRLERLIGETHGGPPSRADAEAAATPPRSQV